MPPRPRRTTPHLLAVEDVDAMPWPLVMQAVLAPYHLQGTHEEKGAFDGAQSTDVLFTCSFPSTPRSPSTLQHLPRRRRLGQYSRKQVDTKHHHHYRRRRHQQHSHLQVWFLRLGARRSAAGNFEDECGHAAVVGAPVNHLQALGFGPQLHAVSRGVRLPTRVQLKNISNMEGGSARRGYVPRILPQGEALYNAKPDGGPSLTKCRECVCPRVGGWGRRGRPRTRLPSSLGLIRVSPNGLVYCSSVRTRKRESPSLSSEETAFQKSGACHVMAKAQAGRRSERQFARKAYGSGSGKQDRWSFTSHTHVLCHYTPTLQHFQP